MKVTDLLTDLLAIGIPALLWVFLLASLFVPHPAGAALPFETLVGWLGRRESAYLAPFLIPFAYVLGVVVDRTADSLLGAHDDRIMEDALDRKRDDYPTSEIPPFYLLRLAVSAKGGQVADFLQYQRGRIRVARSSALNLLLITVGVLLQLPLTPASRPPWWIVLALGAIGVTLTFWAWARISRAYFRKLIDAYFLLYPEAHNPVRRIAKVLVRDGSHFVMARKRSPGKAKDKLLEHVGGHLEEGERPIAGLLREAKEEEVSGRLAAVIARQDPEPREVAVGPTREKHYLFEATLPEGSWSELRPDGKESYGFDILEAADFEDPQGLERIRHEVTPKTLAIHEAMLEARKR